MSLTTRDRRTSALFYRQSPDGPRVDELDPSEGDVFFEHIEVWFKPKGSEELSRDGVVREYQGATGDSFAFVTKMTSEAFEDGGHRPTCGEVLSSPGQRLGSTLYADGTLIFMRAADFMVFILKRVS